MHRKHAERLTANSWTGSMAFFLFIGLVVYTSSYSFSL